MCDIAVRGMTSTQANAKMAFICSSAAVRLRPATVAAPPQARKPKLTDSENMKGSFCQLHIWHNAFWSTNPMPIQCLKSHISLANANA